MAVSIYFFPCDVLLAGGYNAFMSSTAPFLAIPLADLQAMHRKAAELLIADPVYLPIFERIERELAAHTSAQDAISRARAVVTSQKAIA